MAVENVKMWRRCLHKLSVDIGSRQLWTVPAERSGAGALGWGAARAELAVRNSADEKEESKHRAGSPHFDLAATTACKPSSARRFTNCWIRWWTGAATPKALRWELIEPILWTWFLTIPATGAIAWLRVKLCGQWE